MGRKQHLSQETDVCMSHKTTGTRHSDCKTMVADSKESVANSVFVVAGNMDFIHNDDCGVFKI